MAINFEELPKLLKQYIFYITTIKNRSQKTAQAYAIDLKNFFKIYKLKNKLVNSKMSLNEIKISDIDDELIKKITLLDVYEYLNFVMEEKNNSARARARKVSSIKGFFKYLTFNLKILKENPVEHLELPSLKKTLPKYLSIEESKTLLKKTAESNSSNKIRDYCILTLFLNCGMRVSELAGISLKDLKIEEKSLKLLGKGNKERIIFLNDACILAIKNYIKNERNNRIIKDKNALFLAAKTGKRLGVRQIQNIVKLALRKAGLSEMGYSPHKLRHTAATLLYQYGNVDILVLKELLGHANVGTTEIYTHISDKLLKEAVKRNPLADEKVRNKSQE